MEGRSVRPRWLAAAGLSAALWVSAWPGPSTLAKTYDEAQLAGIRQVLAGQGFEPVDDYGKNPDPELPECLPFVSSKTGPERAAGYGIRSGIGTPPAPGLVDDAPFPHSQVGGWVGGGGCRGMAGRGSGPHFQGTGW